MRIFLICMNQFERIEFFANEFRFTDDSISILIDNQSVIEFSDLFSYNRLAKRDIDFSVFNNIVKLYVDDICYDEQIEYLNKQKIEYKKGMN